MLGSAFLSIVWQLLVTFGVGTHPWGSLGTPRGAGVDFSSISDGYQALFWETWGSVPIPSCSVFLRGCAMRPPAGVLVDFDSILRGILVALGFFSGLVETVKMISPLARKHTF